MSEFWAGFFGVVTGVAASAVAMWVQHHLQNKEQKKLDDLRKIDLLHMLENPPQNNEWRKLETLSRVIGADYATTTRLLVEIGARGSETGSDVWALKSQKPLP